jgi:lipopolysaccharide export system permease protein
MSFLARMLKANRIDLYVLKVILSPLRNIFIFVIIILECVRFRIATGLALHQPDAVRLVLLYLGQWLPHYAGLAIQMGLAIGVMVGFARLSQTRELDAMHALGYSLHRLMAPVLALSFLLAGINFYNLGWLQPVSLYRQANFVHELIKTTSLLPGGGDLFLTNGEKTALIDGIAPDSNDFKKIFLYENYKDGKTVATAGTVGTITVLDNDPQQHYSVRNVGRMEIQLKKDTSPENLPMNYSTSNIAKLEGPVNAFDMSGYRERGAWEQELTLPELIFGMPGSKFKIDPVTATAEINYKLAQILFILLLPFIAMLAVVEPRRNPGPMRYLAGLLVILAFHQYMGVATSFARAGSLSPIIGLWVPFVLLTAAVLTLFWRLSTRPGFSTAR